MKPTMSQNNQNHSSHVLGIFFPTLGSRRHPQMAFLHTRVPIEFDSKEWLPALSPLWIQEKKKGKNKNKNNPEIFVPSTFPPCLDPPHPNQRSSWECIHLNYVNNIRNKMKNKNDSFLKMNFKKVVNDQNYPHT